MRANKRHLVLDKSFLYSVSRRDLDELRKDYYFIGAMTLLTESLSHFSAGSQSDGKRKNYAIKAMRKMSDEKGGVTLSRSVGELIYLEIKENKACWPISDYEKGVAWFNVESICEKGLDAEQSNAIDAWNKYVRDNVDLQIDILKKEEPLIFHWNASLRETAANPIEDRLALSEEVLGYIDDCEATISLNVEFVIEQYGKYLRSGDDSLPESLNPSWVLFKYAQVQLLFHLRCLKKIYKSELNLTENNIKKLEHDWLDAEYSILGALYGGIATSDKGVADFFNLLCPDGILVFHDMNSIITRESA